MRRGAWGVCAFRSGRCQRLGNFCQNIGETALPPAHWSRIVRALIAFRWHTQLHRPGRIGPGKLLINGRILSILAGSISVNRSASPAPIHWKCFVYQGNAAHCSCRGPSRCHPSSVLQVLACGCGKSLVPPRGATEMILLSDVRAAISPFPVSQGVHRGE